MTFDKIDLYVDMTYGLLLFVGSVSMVVFQNYLAAVAFGFGVFISYAVHVGWRMARFQPEAKTRFEETVEESVEEQVEESVEQHVGEMQDEVEQTVEEAVEDATDSS